MVYIFEKENHFGIFSEKCVNNTSHTMNWEIECCKLYASLQDLYHLKMYFNIPCPKLPCHTCVQLQHACPKIYPSVQFIR